MAVYIQGDIYSLFLIHIEVFDDICLQNRIKKKTNVFIICLSSVYMLF